MAAIMAERVRVMILFGPRHRAGVHGELFFLGPAMQLLIAVQRLIISKAPKWVSFDNENRRKCGRAA